MALLTSGIIYNSLPKQNLNRVYHEEFTSMKNLHEVDWSKLPSPEDDGAADHLPGRKIASVNLSGSDGQRYDLSTLDGRTVIYAYPMTARPDTPLPEGWDMLPGARGCTPQSCSFRDHAKELRELGISNIFGLSTQTTDYQREAVERLHLPFPLLSDVDLTFTKAMNLPTLSVDGMTLLKRLTLIVDKGQITHVFYPVFPPDQNVQQVIDWLS